MCVLLKSSLNKKCLTLRGVFPQLKGKEVWVVRASFDTTQAVACSKNKPFSGGSLCQAVNLLKWNMTEHAVLGWNPESQASYHFLSKWHHAETEKIRFYLLVCQFWNLVLPRKLFILGLQLQVVFVLLRKSPKKSCSMQISVFPTRLWCCWLTASCWQIESDSLCLQNDVAGCWCGNTI